jgi:hypothetical protein
MPCPSHPPWLEHYNDIMLMGPMSPRNGTCSGCRCRDRLQTWRVVANILKTKSRKTNKRRSSDLGVGFGANNFSP